MSLAVVLPDGRVAAVTSGYSDTTRKIALDTSNLLMQGSVGKTYVAAVAMQLVSEGKLDIDAPIARYLAGATWLDRIANARTITVRQIMNHTSGIVRYEFKKEVTDRLTADPWKVWSPEDRLEALFDDAPPFAPGEGWEYSDTNYIILGMIIEKITGRSYYAELERRILQPLGLRRTVPTDRPEIPGLANGYAGPRNELGGYDASIRADGRFAMNPQFEWTGGGIASTTSDLARWAKMLYEGKAFPSALVERMLESVPAKLGANARYGLGVIVRPSPLGPTWGHSGFFPGYATEMVYFPELRMSAAVQVNTSAPYPGGLPLVLQAAVRALNP
jgi:D-alanyl-D-alanine carboxypeptidase